MVNPVNDDIRGRIRKLHRLDHFPINTITKILRFPPPPFFPHFYTPNVSFSQPRAVVHPHQDVGEIYILFI